MSAARKRPLHSDQEVSKHLRALASFHGIGTIGFEEHRFGYLGIRGKQADFILSLSRSLRHLARHRELPKYDFDVTTKRSGR